MMLPSRSTANQTNAPAGADDGPCSAASCKPKSCFLGWQLYPSNGGQLFVSAEGHFRRDDGLNAKGNFDFDRTVALQRDRGTKKQKKT